MLKGELSADVPVGRPGVQPEPCQESNRAFTKWRLPGYLGFGELGLGQ